MKNNGEVETKVSIDVLHQDLIQENIRLKKFENFVNFVAYDYIELSFEKAQWQRDDWYKRAKKLINKEVNK